MEFVSRIRLAVFAGLLAWALPQGAQAAIFGVPTNLDSSNNGAPCTTISGNCPALSVNPPGWFTLNGTASGNPDGDTVHQLRLFIEVAQSTLDIRIFDPGNSGARDYTSGRTAGTTTTFQLLNPCTPFPSCAGAVHTEIANYGNDANTKDAAVSTDDHLVRFSPARSLAVTLTRAKNKNANATTASAHGYVVGDTVTITGAGAPFDGTFTIATVPTTTTFTYALTNGNAATSAGTSTNVPFFYTLNSANANNASFSGLTPGLYEFRVTMTNAGTLLNGFGVDIREVKGSDTHYNVYTIGDSTSPATALVIGRLLGNAPQADIGTLRQAFFPYVNRGCSCETSNYDVDAPNSSGGDITDLTSVPLNQPNLTMSATTVHSETTVPVETVTTTNLRVDNYGMYFLTNAVGSGGSGNLIDWRVADFQGWNDNPGGLPRDPVNPIRMYLPNGYDGTSVTGGTNPPTSVTAPLEPVLAISANYKSGQDPPAATLTTRFTMTATVNNPAASLPSQPSSSMSSVQVSVGLPSNVVLVGGTLAGFIDGVSAACTDGSGAGFVRCTFASVSAGSLASINYDVDFTPPTTGLHNLTGAPAAGSPPPDSTAWAQYASAFNTTETLGPVCNLIVDVGSSGNLVTRASLTGLRVTPPGVVEFVTGSQRDTLAFNIYGTSQLDGRGPRMRLNLSPVAAPVRDSLTPILYRVETGAITTPYIMIEEIDARSRSHFMGPFAVGDQRLKEAFDRIEARLAGVGTSTRGHARIVPPKSFRLLAKGRPAASLGRGASQRSPYGIKIEVSRAGLVLVPLADLYAQGMPAGLDGKGGTLLLTNRGQRVEFSLTSAGMTFQAGELSTDYTGRNVYVLSWSGREPIAPVVALTRSEDPKQPGTVRVQETWIYYAAAPQGTDPWLWDLLFANEPGWPYPFDVPGLIAGGTADVPVRIRLLGNSSHTHTVQATINGIPAGSVTFTGTASSLLQGRIPAGALAPSGNVLALTYTAAGGSEGEWGRVYFDYVDIDVPVDRTTVPVAPDRVSGFDPRVPQFEGADYLIITHALFRGQAERIAGQKRREGLNPVVVDVERAYDRYSAGIFEANAVRKLISDAAAGNRLRSVLLVGDDTFDYRDYSWSGQVSYIPSLYGWDGEFGRIASENLYADLNSDGAPDLAIGRLPVQTPEEADVLAAKISRQISVVGSLRGRYLFATDNQGPGDISFVGEAQAVINVLPPGSQVTLANLANGVDSARQTLLQGLAQGQLITTYFGHGGPQIWADEGLLTLDDMAGLTNTFRETVLFTWGCEAQFFQYLWGPSINEALLLVPGGGALASFGPAGITDPNLQRILFTKVYDKFLGEGLSLGEAIRQAKAEALAANAATKGVIEGWNLLGDPSLRLPDGPRARPRRGLP